ncbi:MAG: UvrD-helicase domain-containing protein, partial [Rhodospirillales bacterium]|nr:UvrD-helicase domain-containing protein [Rhodospirillales bacterium]
MNRARDRANAAQRRASDPAVSAFVAASAGSGKTKLLTDRLLRLMLADADPARIQCLTFTKAAAAEMAVRLQRELGAWVTLPDARLDAALAERGIAPTPDARASARALFARVLDLPGGMRISTIHSFCQSLLRRFPLEARLSPHFGLLADTDAAAALVAAQESVLAAAHDVPRRGDLAALAGLVSLDEFGTLVSRLQDSRQWPAFCRLDPAGFEAALHRALGAEPDAAARMARAVAWAEERRVGDAARIIAERGSPAVAGRAQRMLAWLGLGAADRGENWEAWRCEFLTGGGAARGMGALVNVKLASAQPALAEILADEQQRILAIDDAAAAAQTAALTAALARLARPVADAFAAHKEGAGLLDYGDLIARSNALLVDPGAAWVLYKLDGGLDHLLLDEVQDTAPAQWAIAGALTAEFFAGRGARDGERRTVFAVGDRKQSIFAFQGADPDGFDIWR